MAHMFSRETEKNFFNNHPNLKEKVIDFFAQIDTRRMNIHSNKEKVIDLFAQIKTRRMNIHSNKEKVIDLFAQIKTRRMDFIFKWV